jgi:hypothetical protein
LSKEDPNIFQKANPDPLHSISKNAKVTLICDPIGQGGFEKVYIATIIDATSNQPKVTPKIPFQDKEN